MIRISPIPNNNHLTRSNIFPNPTISVLKLIQYVTNEVYIIKIL